MRTRKELEGHQVERGRLSCDIDGQQVGNARSYSTKVVKVNHRKRTVAKRDPNVFEQYSFPLY